nr:ankyrin repeat domain-containing protein [Campylobacter avium]
MLNPKEYAKQTDTKRDELLKRYFRYWAYQSMGNYKLYTEFWNEFKQILNPLKKYASQNGLNSSESELFSLAAANEFLYWAVGETKIFTDLDEFSLFILNPQNDATQIKAYIYTKQPNKEELIQALHTALLAKKPSSVIKVFLDLGLNLNEGYESALFYALQSYDNVKFLLQNNANVNYANSFGKTALFYAIEFNEKNIVKLLIENKANVNAKYISNNEKLAIINNIGGNNPYYITFCALEHTSKSVLMHAASYADVEMLKILVENGANLHDVDDLGFNALDFALSAKKMDNAKYLQSLGLKANENLYYGGSLE